MLAALVAVGLPGAGGLSGCGVAGIRLDGPVAVPSPPPPSAVEQARRQVAGASQALLQAVQRIDPATAPGDTAARLAGWVEVHRAHLVALSQPQVARPLGLGGAIVGDTGVPSRPDPVLAAVGLLRTMTGDAVDSASVAVDLGTLFVRIAIARGAQDRQLRSAAGLSYTVADWPADGTPQALQALLAAEHAAVDGYTTAAAWARSRRPEVSERRREHERARDSIAAALVAAGAVPVSPEPGYGLPADVLPGTADPDTRAVTLVTAIEAGLSRACVGAVAALLTAAAEGTAAAAAAGGQAPHLPWSTIRATVAHGSDVEAARQRWGAQPDALPGG